MATAACITQPPDEVAARPPARVPNFDPTLGVAVERETAGEPTHRLVTVGDSLAHGFQNGAIFNTHLSYPALIARELGIYDRFGHPSYERFGGLPLNLEYVLRELEDRFGTQISPWELPFVGLRVRDLMDSIEDFWERDAEPPGRFATRNHNLAVYGWDLHDANTRSADACRQDINDPTDALLRQLVQNANERAALRVLAPGPDGQQTLSPLHTAAALGADGSVESPGEGDGIETLIIALGANNALGTVTGLRVCWSAASSYEDPPAKRHYTVWTPAHFREELGAVLETVRTIRARHVIFATVPHVTIAPVSRGVGPKLADDPRYFPYYTRPWIGDAQFHPRRHPYITGEQARAIDSAIDLYNEALEDAVHAARQQGRDWYLLDLSGHLDRLAARRFFDDPAARPEWWTPYELPPALAQLQPPPDSRFLAAGPDGRRTSGGLFSLDGVHPTTIGYGLMAQEFIGVMERAGVSFAGGVAGTRTQIDFAALLRRDTLVSAPPRSLASVLELLAFIDERYGLLSRLQSRGA